MAEQKQVQPGLSLRPEARPYTYESLTNPQKNVFHKTVALLRDALIQLDQNQKELDATPRFPLRLEQQTRRTNPVIMISGGRGTGKTSLLLTLQRELLTKPTDITQKPDTLADIRQRIVWLETLDLEPLPPNTGLMAAIMARIEQAVNEDTKQTEQAVCRPLEALSRATQDMTNLFMDVCLAWDKDYPRLGGSIDTDLHARESTRVERARTNLRSRFTQLLNDLAIHVPWKGQIERPIFLLPVDDVDLNPARCLELLRLVRSFTTPRFAILLLGDYEVARSVVNLSFLQEFGVLVPMHIDGTDHVWESIQGQACRLGAEAIRKMLPPNQRLRIEQISLEDALTFRPHADAVTLRESLSKIRVPHPLHETQPDLPFDAWMKGGSLWPPETTASAGLVFETTLRKLADLWILLNELPLEAGTQTAALQRLAETLWYEFQRGLVEDGVVTGQDAEQEVEYKPNASLPYGPFHFKFASDKSFVSNMPYPRPSRVRFRFPSDIRLGSPTNHQQALTVNLSKPPTLGRSVMLHDLMVLTESTAYKPLELPRIEQLELVRVDWQVEGAGAGCSVAWPAPRLTTAWDFELFLASWSRYRHKLEGSNEQSVSATDLIPVASFWLALCGAFAFKSAKLWALVEQIELSEEAFTKELVAGYAAQIPDPPTPKKPRRQQSPPAAQLPPITSVAARTDWLRRTAAFLSPENYVDESLARAFFDDPTLQAFWKRDNKDVAVHRKKSVTDPNSLLAHALLNPAKYPEAVRAVLEDMVMVANEIAIAIEGQPNVFRGVMQPSDAVKVLTEEINQALGRVTPTRGNTGDTSWSSPSGPFSKNLEKARNAIGQLRRSASTRTPIGEIVRKDLEKMMRHLATIEGTLELWRKASDHPVNAPQRVQFRPVLSTDDVTA